MSDLTLLAIDFDPIEGAMRDIPRETNDYYLDRVTGRVLALSRALLRFLSDENKERAIALPTWEASMVPVAREIVVDASTRFVRIPEAFGCPEHQMIQGFIMTMPIGKQKTELQNTVKGRWSCHRFKDFLKNDPAEYARWRLYRKEAWKEHIQAWLQKQGILAVDGKPTPLRAETK